MTSVLKSWVRSLTRLTGLMLLWSLFAAGQSDHSQMSDHERHMAELKAHGAEAMGFDQDKTTHHFRLSKDGGAVEVQANDPKDNTSVEQIQHHLAMQAESFAQGNFGAPKLTHGRVPPGVPTMQKLKSEIRYRFEKSEQGAQLIISSDNAEAVKAIHQFLRFQIEDHRTRDPIAVR